MVESYLISLMESDRSGLQSDWHIVLSGSADSHWLSSVGQMGLRIDGSVLEVLHRSCSERSGGAELRTDHVALLDEERDLEFHQLMIRCSLLDVFQLFVAEVLMNLVTCKW